MDFKLQYLLFIVVMFAVTRASIQDNASILKNISSTDLQKVIRQRFEPEIPEHCRNQEICSDVPNYPKEYIDELILRNSTVSRALDFVMGGVDTPAGCKSNKDPYSVELCASRLALVLAKAGKDSEGRWRFLVGEHWFCVEVCENPGTACNTEKAMHLYNNYKATCIQKYIKKHSAALDENGFMMDSTVNVTSACCCHITTTDD